MCCSRLVRRTHGIVAAVCGLLRRRPLEQWGVATVLRAPINGGGFKGGTYFIRQDGIGAAFDKNGLFQYFGVFSR